MEKSVPLDAKSALASEVGQQQAQRFRSREEVEAIRFAAGADWKACVAFLGEGRCSPIGNWNHENDVISIRFSPDHGGSVHYQGAPSCWAGVGDWIVRYDDGTACVMGHEQFLQAFETLGTAARGQPTSKAAAQGQLPENQRTND